MAIRTETIQSIKDLIEVLESERSAYTGPIWFRGQTDASWSLVPGYYRTKTSVSESTMVKRFKQNASMLISAAPKASFEWLFLMQHYGVPTRLLDWSESPLVGLYFAVNEDDEQPGKEAALWSLHPPKLNSLASITDDDEEDFIPSFEEELLSTYSVESLQQNRRTKLNPVAAIATRNNERIQAQHGVFTIHHHLDSPLEELGDSSHVAKYVVPESCKETIRSQLRLLGFTKFQLFPELSSIGELIKRGM